MPSFGTLVGSAALLLSILPGSVLGSVVKREYTVPVPVPTSPPGGHDQNSEEQGFFGCNLMGVTEYFSNEYPVPEECQDYYAAQVIDFCIEYRAVEKTVYTATVTPSSMQTSTVVVTTTVKPPVARRDASLGSVVIANRNDDEAPEGCRDLTQDDSFTRHPHFMIRSACRCLPTKPYTTVYAVSTADAPVKTVTSTKTVTETP